jgi:hypothetical protein
MRVRVVADDIAETNIMRALLFFGIAQHRLERFEVRVNVAENGVTHLL